MELLKFKITTDSLEGYMVLTYHDGTFKSLLNEFKPRLTDKQLNLILNHITADPAVIKATFENRFKGKVTVAEIADDKPSSRISTFCALYEKHTGIKYKTTPAEAGKMKQLQAADVDLTALMELYFECKEWWAKDKSMSNFYKNYNQLRALEAARPATKAFPLPYDENYYLSLNLQDKRDYHKYLRDNGYRFENNGRVGKWIKNDYITQNAQ